MVLSVIESIRMKVKKWNQKILIKRVDSYFHLEILIMFLVVISKRKFDVWRQQYFSHLFK